MESAKTIVMISAPHLLIAPRPIRHDVGTYNSGSKFSIYVHDVIQ